VGNVESYLSERTDKATQYKIWPSSRDQTCAEMEILQVDVVRECYNNPTTHTMKCTGDWGIIPWEYPQSWGW